LTLLSPDSHTALSFKSIFTKEITMKFNRAMAIRVLVLFSLMASLTMLSSRLQADTGSCGGVTVTLPFTDVQGNPFFCQIAAAYFSGLTNGTSATTYTPGANVTREQMAAFTTRTMDQSLRRGSRRAALNQWATPTSVPLTGKTTVGISPRDIICDGADLWVANFFSGTVSRVRASDGKLLETWTGATAASGIVIARSRVFITGDLSPGKIYVIDPKQAAGAVTTLTSSLPASPRTIAFDGFNLWTANSEGGFSISRVNPNTGAVISFPGYDNAGSIFFDGTHIWVTETFDDAIKKVDPVSGNILQTINVGMSPIDPVFDGTNIWVPNPGSDSVTVVRVKDAVGNPLVTAFVLATLTGNGLNSPSGAAFDGERVLITNDNSVSLWKAADLTPLGSFTGPAGAFKACSDGLNFWITLSPSGEIVRF
jgi:hypothetical protein